MLRVDLHDGGGAVLVIHVGIGIGGVGSAVGVEGGGDVGEAAKELVGGGARRDAGRVFGRFGGEGSVEVERLVRDDGGLEGRRDALRQQRLPRDGGEERVPLHALDAIGACGLVDRGIAVQSTNRLFSYCIYYLIMTCTLPVG